MPLVSLRDVRKSYPAASKNSEPVTAVAGVDLDIDAGDVFGIIGYSGAGKSTLVRLINALEPVTSGSVLIDGVDVSKLGEKELRKLRLGIGMIFQQFNLFDSKTVFNNVAYPLRVARTPKPELQRRVAELLKFVGLADKAGNYPEQLSGGQKQRVGIARALATSPRILLADEATSALDPETTHEVLSLLKRVNEEFGVTIIVITHEMDVIQTLANKVAVMDRGRVVEQGDVFEVFSRPREASSQRFVATVVRGVPSPAELSQLRERHPGRIVTLSFRDGSGSQGAVFLELAQAGIGFELVYGGINDIRGQAFGHLTLALTGADAAIDTVLARFAETIEVTESTSSDTKGADRG
ncbi:methionine ABC transporter ATP-binding protein [Herbiconiux sp. CPCC 203407]|uniref:Methionine ABC transporter ATP-binding protein n=1 Tax=Herbiconiux oxytropis TaxID=2970915 RepID=A0AA41XJ44_9MICO|nr:methionine ABC transporter ATP-binding protein [Herbiconiux oxytropis]MCS5724089.1 methionine ABC transporter ATP-binding protein [Herbiconiux oxytropis]MCS5726978.1 methionine ABC transporter ATP-binding protein [Herbiconiux oxytropis]